ISQTPRLTPTPYTTLFRSDINTLSVTDSIFLGEQSNQIFEEDNRLWVLSQSEYQGRVKDHIYYVNLSDRSVDSVKVGSNPTNWALGDDEQLYVYCRGAESSDDPAIYSIGISSQSMRSEEHTSELQSRENLVCRLLL